MALCVQGGRTLSTATCAETSGPRLFVLGVCSCADLIIGEQSVKDELRNLTVSSDSDDGRLDCDG